MEDLVAVGSAIRTCVAALNAGEALAYSAILLDSGARSPVPATIELELVKMVVRKLSANPPKQADSFPELADRLDDIVNAYLNRRLLARERFGAITLNAILGLALLHSRRFDRVERSLLELDVPWFRRLLARRRGVSVKSCKVFFPLTACPTKRFRG